MKNSLLVLGILLVLAGPLILISGTTYTMMLPNMYESIARIKISEDVPEVDPFSPQQNYDQSYDPRFLNTQCEIIQSGPIFYEVIARLNLQEEWGRDAEKLPRNVSHRILQNSVSVFQHRDTSLLCISVKRDNPMEAAKIANEIAEVYRNSRLELANKEVRAVIGKVEEALKEQQITVDLAGKKVEEIGDDAQDSQVYRNAQSELETEEFILKQLKAKLRQETIMMQVPRNPVEIIDIAEPNNRPVSPNLFLNVLVSLGAGLLVVITGIILIVSGGKNKSPSL